jgi:ubiquinol-cytochrome c reductase cytochrome b subunit
VRSAAFRSFYKVSFWFFLSNCLILGWIGGKSVEEPFYTIGQLATFSYFWYLLFFVPFILFLEKSFWNRY